MKELKKQWKNGEFKGCYLFFGPEAYLIKNYEKALMEALLPPGSEIMNHDIFEEKRASEGAIMDAAETLPFLNEKRLITVRNSGFFQKGNTKEEGERLLDYFSQLPESVCILFIEEKAEKNSRLYKAMVKYGEAVEFKTPGEKELAIWIKKECEKNGTSIEGSVVQFFLQTVESNMESIEREMQKLLAYKGNQGNIEIGDIKEICTPSLEAKVFDLVRAVVEEKPEKAISIYHNLLLLKESPYMVLSLITRQFRLILLSSLLSGEGMPNSEISQRLEIRDFAVREYINQARRFSKEAWKMALKDCLKTDLDIKTGRVAEEAAVELLIMKYSCKALRSGE
ncbi:DNA polymerase III subunit delta [Anaerotignum neopropionicum]|uniref:DNA polymerase III subunit delta n=1 Tax=Anaerotignum neopropionicum TaxID=36847 RepID=A0A136WEV1_9FIRM|nr:DNA polymerase III subunit delta [Anaerotignum neopropionicum]KXL53030.1 DNA polymerase III subunit delta [Anaerotignum neopropionicum]